MDDVPNAIDITIDVKNKGKPIYLNPIASDKLDDFSSNHPVCLQDLLYSKRLSTKRGGPLFFKDIAKEIGVDVLQQDIGRFKDGKCAHTVNENGYYGDFCEYEARKVGNPNYGDYKGTQVFGCMFIDLNDDTWDDLFCIIDFGNTRMFLNDGAGSFLPQPYQPPNHVFSDPNLFEFSEIARNEEYGKSGIVDAMGSTIGDINEDGHLDIFLSAISCPGCTNGRLFYGQKKSGNRLYIKGEGFHMKDKTTEYGVLDGGWGWGTTMFDFDNDGDLDIAMVNGFDFAGSTEDILATDSKLFENILSCSPGRPENKCMSSGDSPGMSIVYNDWLPALLGPNLKLGPYTGYNPDIKAEIKNEFATAAARFGHSQVNNVQLCFEADNTECPHGHLLLRDSYFKPGSFRGRDHGLADFNQVRKDLGLYKYTAFEEITSDKEITGKLKRLYKGKIDNIDLFVGGLAEDKVPGGNLGPTFGNIIKTQFEILRDGDRFYFENNANNLMSEEEVQEIKSSGLCDILKGSAWGTGSGFEDSIPLTCANNNTPSLFIPEEQDEGSWWEAWDTDVLPIVVSVVVTLLCVSGALFVFVKADKVEISWRSMEIGRGQRPPPAVAVKTLEEKSSGKYGIVGTAVNETRI
ncbi:hypothetical protein TrVE_jg750 [Triparma verrucosa]|uniref:Uncharacterized protein n=1 Tax=Triparma verrucosa TaxID=1606542 RepID=A0A9W7FBV9_9STRA|nr:hypothetical protein TrVE_jg750 [Triparma verrucosa]